SRRRHTRFSRDWSSDVCSSDLETTFDFATLLKNREAYIDRSRNSYGAGFERRGVEVINGHAKFIDNQTVEVNGEKIRSKHILIEIGRASCRERRDMTADDRAIK